MSSSVMNKRSGSSGSQGAGGDPAGTGVDAPAEDARLLAELERVTDRLSRVVLSAAVDDDELTASVAVLGRVQRKLAGERLRRVAEVDERAAYLWAGAGSTAAWLADELAIPPEEAARDVTTAVGLTDLPETARRLGAGELDESSARRPPECGGRSVASNPSRRYVSRSAATWTG